MTHLPDKELLKKFRDESARSAAFDQIVKKYKEKVYWYARRLVISHEDAADVTQDVFLKAWKNLLYFREDASLNTWLYRIATNESINFIKRKSKKIFVPYEELKEQLLNSFRSEQYISDNEIHLKLEKAVLQLPEKQRVVFILRYFEDKKYDEIAEITGTSVGSLQASYHHAVQKIEKNLKNS